MHGNIPLEDFQMPTQIIKSLPSRNGRMRIGVWASDERVDLQNEVVTANGISDSLDYLKSWGKYNDNHSSKLVGDIDHAEITTIGDLVRRGIFKSAEVPQTEYPMRGLWTEGFLYPKIEEAKRYWNILKSGGHIGGSIQGKVLSRPAQIQKGGKTITVHSKVFCNQVALTGEPINPGTKAKIMDKAVEIIKSLQGCGACGTSCSHACEHGGHCIKDVVKSMRTLEAKRNIACRELRKGMSSEDISSIDISKAMTEGSDAIVSEGVGEPGDASKLRLQSLNGNKKKRRVKKVSKSFTSSKGPHITVGKISGVLYQSSRELDGRIRHRYMADSPKWAHDAAFNMMEGKYPTAKVSSESHLNKDGARQYSVTHQDDKGMTHQHIFMPSAQDTEKSLSDKVKTKLLDAIGYGLPENKAASRTVEMFKSLYNDKVTEPYSPDEIKEARKSLIEDIQGLRLSWEPPTDIRKSLVNDNNAGEYHLSVINQIHTLDESGVQALIESEFAKEE